MGGDLGKSVLLTAQGMATIFIVIIVIYLAVLIMLKLTAEKSPAVAMPSPKPENPTVVLDEMTSEPDIEEAEYVAAVTVALHLYHEEMKGNGGDNENL